MTANTPSDQNQVAGWSLFDSWSGQASLSALSNLLPQTLAADWAWCQTTSHYQHARHPETDYTAEAAVVDAIRSNPSIRHIIQVGIGGSVLGTRMLYHALRRLVPRSQQRPVSFISNLDSDDAEFIISTCDKAHALFIVVSKSGYTQETQVNLERLRQHQVVARQIIVITSPGSPLDSNAYRHVLYLDERIGGRFSALTSVSGVLIGAALDPTIMAAVRAGAHAADKTAQPGLADSNIALRLAYISSQQAQQYRTHAIIPYSQPLIYFPAYLQQLLCESNGKSTTRTGEPVSGHTAPVIFGELGTVAQHSFFQLLHAGTQTVPVSFIASRYTQLGQTDQPANRAHIMAQMTLMRDRGTPVQLLIADRLTPETVGALIAIYDNMAVFQGILWRLNPFDQPGVESGKQHAAAIIAGDHAPDPELAAFL